MYSEIDVDATEIFGAYNNTGTPERRLLLAILERAILDYVGNDEDAALSSVEWFSSENTSCNVAFSFPWICQQLDLDIDRVLKRIIELPKRGARRGAPWYFQEAC